MTAADLAVGAMAALATAFLAWAVVRAGGSVTTSLLLLLAGGSLVAALARSWMRARGKPARRLVACADGSLWLLRAGQVPCRATVGVGTRLIGPSVFLDLLVDSTPAGERLPHLADTVRRAHGDHSPLERGPAPVRAPGWFVNGRQLR